MNEQEIRIAIERLKCAMLDDNEAGGIAAIFEIGAQAIVDLHRIADALEKLAFTLA